MVSHNQNARCALKQRYENTDFTLFKEKEIVNECKVATIKSLKEQNRFQGDGRETLIQRKGGDRQRLRVKTTQLIQFLPVQMLLLNLRNMVIAFETKQRSGATETKLKPGEGKRETASKKIEEQISNCLGENNAYTESIISPND